MTKQDETTNSIIAEAMDAAAATSTLATPTAAHKRAATPDATEETPSKKPMMAHRDSANATAKPLSGSAAPLPKAILSPRQATHSVSPTLQHTTASTTSSNPATAPLVPIAPAPSGIRATTPSLIAVSPPTVPTSPTTKATAFNTTTSAASRAAAGSASNAAADDKKSTPSSSSLRGLRHFSLMVCKKVEEKGTTTYNEVADELVAVVLEDRKNQDPADNTKNMDEKNIRRRVYDALNVLMAMDIIGKDKKQITWKGLPTHAHHDWDVLEREQTYRQEQVQAKRRALQEILVQQVCFHNLVKHNKQNETSDTKNTEKIPLPFIVVNTHKEAVIDCNMNPDMNDVVLDFDRPFEINDDNSILTRLGMHKTSLNLLRDLVPQDLLDYCQHHGLLKSVLGQSNKAGKETPPPIGLTSSGSNKGHFFTSLE